MFSRSSGKATLTGNGFPWLYASARPQQGAALAGFIPMVEIMTINFTGRSQPKSSVARQAESGDLAKKTTWENETSFHMFSHVFTFLFH